MRALTATELSRMRDVQEVALPDTCTIQEATESADSIGQITKAWAAVAANVPCRLSQVQAGERIAGERVATVTTWVLTVAHDQTIETDHRVIVGTRTFQVVGVNTGESWETATRAELVEVA